MATTVLPETNVTRISYNRRYEHLFFSGMALLILATVFLGFARTYFLAGVFHAPLPNLLIHLHGALFSSWILLLVAQTSLVSAGRTDIHRRLGVFGFLLASLMVILGIVAGTDALRRGFTPPGISTGKLHRATLWAGISLIVAQQLRFPIAQTNAWHAIATWALSIANSLHGA